MNFKQRGHKNLNKLIKKVKPEMIVSTQGGEGGEHK